MFRIKTAFFCTMMSMPSLAMANIECGADIYEPTEITADLQRIEAALKVMNEETLIKIGARIERNVKCLEKPAPPQVYATLYRFIGLQAQLSGNIKEASRWYRTSLELLPSFSWGPDELPAESAIRSLWERQRTLSAIDQAPMPGHQFALPDGTAVYIDGKKISKPIATADRPHILLLVDADTSYVQGRYLIDGNQFPASLVQPYDDKAAQAQEEADIESLFAVNKVERVRPPLKTPMIVTGGIALIASVGIYAYTFKTNADFDLATSTDDLLKIQSFNNSLIIASGVVGFLGVGTGYAGVQINHRPVGWDF